MSIENKSENKSEHPVLRGVGIFSTILGVAILNPAVAIAGAILWYLHRKRPRQ